MRLSHRTWQRAARPSRPPASTRAPALLTPRVAAPARRPRLLALVAAAGPRARARDPGRAVRRRPDAVAERGAADPLPPAPDAPPDPAALAPDPGAPAPLPAPPGSPTPGTPGAPAPLLAPQGSPTPGTPGAPAPLPAPPGSPTPGTPGAPAPLGPAPGAPLGPAPGAPPAAATPAPPPPPAEPSSAVATSDDELVTVRVEITPDPSRIGDLLTLQVTAAYSAGVTVNLPAHVELAPLHLVAVDESEPEPTGTGLRKVFTLTLQWFDTGVGRVPGFPLTYLTPEGEVHTVTVPPVGFTVESLLANENDPQRKPEDPPISLEYPNERAELILYSALGALLLGFVGMLLWNRLRRRARPVWAPPPVPAHERALEALDELERSELIAEARYQDYYLELTEIAKGYLEGRFGVEALDRTTDEIRRALTERGERIEPLTPAAVLRFLENADLVKFARAAPPEDEARAALGEVREMVTSTIPKERKPEAATDEGPRADEASAAVSHAGTSRSASASASGVVDAASSDGASEGRSPSASHSGARSDAATSSRGRSPSASHSGARSDAASSARHSPSASHSRARSDAAASSRDRSPSASHSDAAASSRGRSPSADASGRRPTSDDARERHAAVGRGPDADARPAASDQDLKDMSNKPREEPGS
ncbi:MAG: hypothetical protein R3A51_04825 [Nannocystaceae bacterium]